MTGTAVEEVKAIILVGVGEILRGKDSPYELGRRTLQNEYKPILAASAGVTKVESAEEAEKAVEFGRLLQAGTKETEAYFKSIKVQIDDIKKPVLSAEKEDVGVLDVEKRRLAGLLTTYTEKVEQERQAAEKKAREEQEAEARRQREEQERVARDEQIARAIAAEESGDATEAETILDAPVQVEETYQPPVMIQATAPTRFAGSSGKTTYTAAVIGWEEKMLEKQETHPGWVNFRILVKAVAEGKAPLRALLPNESFIAGQGRDYKEGFSMPGCEGKKAKSTSFRG